MKTGNIVRLKHTRAFVRVLIPYRPKSEINTEVFYGICISEGLPEEYTPFYKGLQMDYQKYLFRKSSKLEFWIHMQIVKFTKWYFGL